MFFFLFFLVFGEKSVLLCGWNRERERESIEVLGSEVEIVDWK
jgi:hypothetical protein